MIYSLIECAWTVFVLYWLAGTLKTRRTVSQESAVSRGFLLGVEILGFILLFGDIADVGFLGQRMVPTGYVLAPAAVILTWIGIAITLWARRCLGQNWSARVAIKEDHKLIGTGPYAVFRHPIYSGLDLAAVGTAFAINRWRCAVGVALLMLGYWLKARKEESMLAPQFGVIWEAHYRKTGFLLPKF